VLLEAAGTDWAHVTKTGVYLANLSDFAEMNKVYETYLTKPYPARTTVGVNLPNILIEVDVIAVLPE
jgi:2-iminobutanoate/2-iminopropanoate deaminase